MSRKKQQEKEKQIHVRVPAEIHKRLRVKCAYEDLSIQQYMEKLLKESLAEYGPGRREAEANGTLR